MCVTRVRLAHLVRQTSEGATVARMEIQRLKYRPVDDAAEHRPFCEGRERTTTRPIVAPLEHKRLCTEAPISHAHCGVNKLRQLGPNG